MVDSDPRPNGDRPVVYTAMPKYFSVMDPYIGSFVYNHGGVPLTPYQYPMWLMDKVDRDVIRDSNERIIETVDEVWVFSAMDLFGDSETVRHGLDIADGIEREIQQAKKHGKPVYFHAVDVDSQEIDRVGELTEHC